MGTPETLMFRAFLSYSHMDSSTAGHCNITDAPEPCFAWTPGMTTFSASLTLERGKRTTVSIREDLC